MYTMPYHPEEQAIEINKIFGKYALGNEPTVRELAAVVEHQVELIRAEACEFRDADNEQKWRDALCDILITAFGLPYLMGMEHRTPFIIANTRSNPDDVRGSVFTVRDHLIATGYGAATTLATLEENKDFFVARDAIHMMHVDKLLAFSESLSTLEAQDYKILISVTPEAIQEMSDDEYSAYAIAANILSSVSVLITECYITSLGAHVNLDYDLKLATDAMISRLCTNEQAVIDTIEKYKAIGVDVVARPSKVIVGSMAMIVDEDATGTDNEFYPKGKFVKSVEFHEPVYPARPGVEWVHKSPIVNTEEDSIDIE